MSDNGKYVGFVAEGYPGFYVRIDGQSTIEVSKSQRSTDDPAGTTNGISAAGIADDGSAAFFKSVLGADRRRQHRREPRRQQRHRRRPLPLRLRHQKTDRPDRRHQPGRQSTGANVTASSATTPTSPTSTSSPRGELAPGRRLRGRKPLRLARRRNQLHRRTALRQLRIRLGRLHTPDGRNVLFASTRKPDRVRQRQPENGEDDADGLQVHLQGTRSSASPAAPAGPADGGHGPDAVLRPVSDDGSRVFFESTDAILPESTDGLERLRVRGRRSAAGLAAELGPDARPYGASASGDDVFFQTFGELTPEGQGEVMGDLRRPRQRRTAARPPRPLPGRKLPHGADRAARKPPARAPPASRRRSGSRSPRRKREGKDRAAEGHRPRGRRMTISGKGLKTIKKSVSKAGSVTVHADA